LSQNRGEMSHNDGRMAIYPGTFDPVTKGHIDIAQRTARLFDQVIVAVYDGGPRASKTALFTADERVALVKNELCQIVNVTVDTFDELLVDYAHKVGAQTIVRGLRAVSDFEFEFQLAHMYRHLDPELEVVCLMTSSQHSFISSSIIKEVASLGGSVDDLVPQCVAKALNARFGKDRS
jgi:pantetheine-phosphate adenylyltransferase